MFRTQRIHKLLGLHRSRRLHRRQAAQTRKPLRLVLEPLEKRLTPSGGDPTVTQTANSYSQLTTLIAGDTAANTNYIIQITNSFTFSAGGQVTISGLGSGSTLTIEGQNGTNYTLTGNGNRLFDITSGQTVTLANLTLTGGSGVTDGGAILDSGGSVSLSGETNTATGTATSLARGGGVFVFGGGSLSLTNTLIAQHRHRQRRRPRCGGRRRLCSGASTVTITDSILSGNKATGGAGAAGTKAGASGSTGGSTSGGAGRRALPVLWPAAPAAPPPAPSAWAVPVGPAGSPV